MLFDIKAYNYWVDNVTVVTLHEIKASNEDEAIEVAKTIVKREHYRVIDVTQER